MESRIADIKKAFTGSASPLAVSGASLYWAWVDHVAFTNSFAEDGGSGIFALSFLSVCACSILILGLFALSSRFSGFLVGGGNRLLFLLGAGGVAGSLVSFLSGGSVVLLVCASLLTGACFSGYVIAWGEICIAEGHRKALLHISSAWSVGLVVNLAIGLLQPFASAFVLSLLPIASYGVYRMLAARRDDPTCRIIVPKNPGRSKADHGFDSRLLMLICAFCAAFGIMYYSQIVVSADGFFSIRGFDAVVTRGCMALFVLALYLGPLRDRMHLLFKACSFALIVGLAAMVVGVFTPHANRLGSIAIAAGYCSFDILVWTMIAAHGRSSRHAPWRIICIAMIAEQAGILAGASVGAALSLLDVSSGVRMAILTGMNLAAVAALLGFTEYGSRLWMLMVQGEQSDDSAPNANRADDGIRAFAGAYGLTERETEILGLFVTGRSMSYIAEELVVSTNTVKTHIRHIYAKCGAHGKQELIDMVQKYRLRPGSTSASQPEK